MYLGVIIAAGGAGIRMNRGQSKQLLALAEKPVLVHAVGLFDSHEAVGEIVIAIGPDDVERCRSEVIRKYGFKKVSGIVPGGDARPQSVSNALNAMGSSVDTVAVHDGARPLFPVEILDRGLKVLESDSCDGVVFGLPVTDTIKEVGNGVLVERTPDRSRLWVAQTPQIFRRSILEKAYSLPRELVAAATDDAFLVETVGGRVKMTMGSEENIKITRPLDLVVAEEIIRRRSAT